MGNDESIGRMRKSKHYFIGAIFHLPPDFIQLLIVMSKILLQN